MNISVEVVSFLDLLDLDEEIIDTRLKTIMERTTFTNKHLSNAIHLLQYKHFINVIENTFCSNEEECAFIAKLMNNCNNENIDNICRIVYIVLTLNEDNLVSQSEHLIQQILSNIELPSSKPTVLSDEDVEKDASLKTYFYFKLCNSILDAVRNVKKQLCLPFLEIPLENVLLSSDETLKICFLNDTVPRLFEAISGYSILDRIWNFLKQSQLENKESAIRTLSCLSEFYLPVPDSSGVAKYASDIVTHFEFWTLLLYGLKSINSATRKTSVYLIKRAIDNLLIRKSDVQVSSETKTIFNWRHKEDKVLKENWDNFFILIDSLEETQSNIVLPSLQLFGSLKHIESCWINCAYTLGLKHDNTLVRLKCIEYRLMTNLDDQQEALVLLEALNDINLYDSPKEYEQLKCKIDELFKDLNSLVYIIKTLVKVKWTPVPLYHLSEVLAKQNVDLSTSIDSQLTEIMVDILKIPCNHIPIRDAIKINITYFIGQCCKGIHWRDLIYIYSLVKWNKFFLKQVNFNPFILNMKNLNLTSKEKEEFFKIVTESYVNIDCGLLYLENHCNDVDIFVDCIIDKMKKIQDAIVRQYAEKSECLKYIVFVTHLFNKSKENHKETIALILSREYKRLMQYVFTILSSDTYITIDEIILIFRGLDFMNDIICDDIKVNELIVHMYKGAAMFLKLVEADLEKKLLAINIIKSLTKKMRANYKHEILSSRQILEITKVVGVKEPRNNTEDVGRYRNSFYEKTCELVHEYVTEEEEKSVIKKDLQSLIDFIENVIECGGYGCLKWVIKIMNLCIQDVIDNKNLKFNLTTFISRMWKEIEELKSNSQYTPCIIEFVKLITHEALLKIPVYNNVVLFHCSKIIDYGHLKNSPLYYLVETLSKKDLGENFGQIIYMLCDILLFSPVPRKDQRIADNLAIEILQSPKYDFNMDEIETHFNFTIQYLAVLTLSKIKSPEIFKSVASFIISKVNSHLHSKPRYHGNSQTHRILLAGLQHLLFLPLLNVEMLESQTVSSWMIELLGQMPHQPSVKICLEWYISLHFYVKNCPLDNELVDNMKTKNVPITSQFIILYWTMSRKISDGSYTQQDYEFVMDFLCSHTMGQMFNIRLHAQYLATQLHKKADEDSEKYSYIIEIIQKTFGESCKDKNFVKLREDFFIKDFDIVAHAVPSFIYHFLPKYCEVGYNDVVDERGVRSILFLVNDIVKEADCDNDFKEEWLAVHKSDDEVFQYTITRFAESKDLEKTDSMGTIQKKYVPWRNMSDVHIYETRKKKESLSELIVVASLIDKLPNLGGMARTSEVFGVKTYVVNSLRHLQEKQFQGLSVSAERWVNVEEVCPGQPLKDYLMRMKSEGYAVVAAEQTSTSCPLQSFRFPKKTVLLLGHEKEGVPCDLLPMMDHCVEVPQQGVVRSLNVHVTAAIFIWEYSRQNIL